jgi:hypothetical protein
MQVQKSEFIFSPHKPSFFLPAHLTLGRLRTLCGEAALLLRTDPVHMEPLKIMTNDIESNAYTSTPEDAEQHRGWFRIGVVAVASALAGGIAAAWWYRKTLNKLHESGENNQNPQFGISEDGRSTDPFDEF